MSKGGIPLDEWSGAKATKELHETIQKFVEQSDRQSRTMIKLTWAIVGLTIAVIVLVAVQIVLLV